MCHTEHHIWGVDNLLSYNVVFVSEKASNKREGVWCVNWGYETTALVVPCIGLT